MNKSQLRHEILAARKSVSSPLLSAQICDKAAALDVFRRAHTVMLYLPTGSEVDTSRLLSLSLSLGKKVCAPKVLSDTEMEARYIDRTGFRKGRFQIWEPMGPPADSIDLVFVPGAVFDPKGHRIGYGKGYYDRFLRNTAACKVGLCYACQMVPSIPAEPHDVRLDMILTEDKIYT